MLDYIDDYCERISFGLWGEPFNTLSNLGFIIAAVMLIRVFRNPDNGWSGKQLDIWTLILLMFAIGIGSGLWHIYAQRWALHADAIPILVFINVFLLVSFIRVLHFSIWKTLLLFVAYHFFNITLQSVLPKDFANGSIFYLPTWASLLGITLALWYRKSAVRTPFAIATVLFCVSLLFRTIDNFACSVFPIGTHFVWHLINGFMLYQLMLGLLKSRQPRIL